MDTFSSLRLSPTSLAPSSEVLGRTARGAHSFTLPVLLAMTLSTLVACGGSVASGTPSGPAAAEGADADNGGASSPAPAASSAGAPAAPPVSPTPVPGTPPERRAVDSTIVLIEVKAEVLGAIPKKVDGDQCEPSGGRISLDRLTRQITFHECLGPAGRRVLTDIRRALSPAEDTEIEAMLDQIRYDATLPCDGMDGPLASMVTTSNLGKKQLYVHKNINCYKDDRRRAPDVEKLYFALAVLPRSVAQDTP